jgi:hypothetical protein
MSAAACFHSNGTGLAVSEKICHLVSIQLLPTYFTRFHIYPVKLKNALCQIQSNYSTIHIKPSLPFVVVLYYHFDTLMPLGTAKAQLIIPSLLFASGRREESIPSPDKTYRLCNEGKTNWSYPAKDCLEIF